MGWCGADCTYRVWDRAVMDTVMNRWVRKNAGILLTWWGIINFSRLRVVSNIC